MLEITHCQHGVDLTTTRCLICNPDPSVRIVEAPVFTYADKVELFRLLGRIASELETLRMRSR